MAYKYEITIAPSELVSNFGAITFGNYVEVAIFSHYLTVTGAPRKPAGDETLVDFFDTGVPQDYVKLLIERHAPNLNQKELRADARIKDALGVPDISTYEGRFVPPRMLAADRIEDRNRNEYYEIKPNSDTGEHAGRQKLAKIVAGNKRYGLFGVYQAGVVYPPTSPTYIPLKWSEAFEYLRLVFMWENNLKTCDLDLQVVQLPNVPGLILYAIRIRLELDVRQTGQGCRGAGGEDSERRRCHAALKSENFAALFSINLSPFNTPVIVVKADTHGFATKTPT